MRKSTQAKTTNVDQCIVPAMPVLSVDDVVNLASSLCDVSEKTRHIINGTEQQYYKNVIQSIVYHMTVIPVDRVVHESDESDESSDVMIAFTTISHTLADFFGKPATNVEEDMVDAMDKFPIDDVRQSRILQQRGLLH